MITTRTPEEKMAKRMEKYTQLKKLDKETLFQRFNCLQRVHGLTKNSPKLDLITAILDIENPMPKGY